MALEKSETRPLPNEHSCRLKPPNYKSYARENCKVKHEGKCIDFVYGIKGPNQSELQSMRYKTKIWTEEAARAHCKEKEGTFEPAKEEDNFYPDLEDQALKISATAIAQAKKMIAAGKIEAEGNWSFDSKDSHALMDSVNGDWSKYGLWFLVYDDQADEDTYQRYKYPYGKQGKVWRRAVIAAKQRAAQQKFTVLVEAADELLQAIDKKIGKEEDSLPRELEIRNIPMQEMEARLTEDGKMVIEGYAIVYNREAEIWGDIEIILPGAATEALKVEDQYYLWQHDIKSPLARKKIGTLTAEEDESGVFIRAQVIDTHFGQDCYRNVATGLVDKQSFAFRVNEEGEDWKTKKENGKTVWIRYIKKFAIIPEFSAVTFPAYEDTTLQARCRQLAFRNRPNPGTPGKASAAALEVLKEARANIEVRRKSIEERSQYEKD